MDRPRHIQDLADEVLSEILSFLLEVQSKALDGEMYGNEQSCTSEPGSDSIGCGEASDLDRFRLVCKRFMRIGTPRKFSRFVLRFSPDGFQRLGDLLDMQLACYVKNVTYMVRPFYQGSGWKAVLRALGSEHASLAQIHSARLRDQSDLIETGDDLSRLRCAVSAFSSLQEIKLLRLQDEADELLVQFIHDRSLGDTVQFDWEPACSRAVTSLGIALLDSKCSSIRFIGPQISPEATLKLLRAPSPTLAAVGGRLTSLNINFHSATDITPTMADLSGVFHRFFMAAKNLIAIHLGFPIKLPLDLELEALFHHIRWKALRTLSIQGWRLSANEIVALVRRHCRQLRDFRLAGIYLRAGAHWHNVLTVLRDEMEQLERVDLRELDYATSFDAMVTTSGVEILDNHPTAAPPPSSLTVAAATSPTDPRSTPDASNLPGLVRSASLPDVSSLEKLRSVPATELGDNGTHVQTDQLPLWEAWVLSGSRRFFRNGQCSK